MTRSLLIITFAALIPFTLFGLSGCAYRSPEAVRNMADHHYKYGHFEQAAEGYEYYVSRYPGDWHAQYQLGLCRMELRDWSGARRALDIAYARKPNNPDIANALAEVMYQQGSEQQLFAFLRQSAESTQSVMAYLRWAHYAMELGDPDSARIALNTAITLDAGESVDPYLVAADFAEQIGDLDMAVHRLRQAYGIDPYDARVRERLISYGEVPGPTLALPPGR